MKVVFMGTPDFAARSLQKLLDEGFDIAGVFCQPDKPRGRGNLVSACPVKELSAAAGLPLFQPAKLRDGTALQTLRALSPDAIVVVAYGRILPDEFLALPPLGCVNIHGSLLPRYRGSAPIQWAVLNGDRQTGVTSMFVSHEMDTGDIIYQESTPIGEFETSGELFVRLADMGAELLVKTLRALEAGDAPRTPQPEQGASSAPPLTKAMSRIDWARPPRAVVKQICGLQPWPCATAELGGSLCKIFGAQYTQTRTDLAPGSIVSADRLGIEVACAGGQTVLLTSLQAPGGKRMSAAAWLLGHPLNGHA